MKKLLNKPNILYRTVIVFVIFCVTFILVVNYSHVFAWFVEWVHSYHSWQLNPLRLTILFLLFATFIFSWQFYNKLSTKNDLVKKESSEKEQYLIEERVKLFLLNKNVKTNIFNYVSNDIYWSKFFCDIDIDNQTLKSLINMMETKDPTTKSHLYRLQFIVTKLAKTYDMPKDRVETLRLLALFHDIGKVHIPDCILFKPEALSNQEFIKIQQHSEIGKRMTGQDIPELAPISNLILNHHEWWNGKGYPLGNKKEEIPLACRFFSVMDAYDIMTHDRPYGKAISHKEAILELKNCSGTQFDPYIATDFVEIFDVN